ncbi:MAG: acyltransferase family protein, partial [Promethearchaeota archaeon]
MTTESIELKKPRLLFLDNIKLMFAILVIFNHARVTYEGSGWWYYIEENTLDLFSSILFQVIASFGGVFQSSLLGLFFLMGGFLTPKSYDRKGIKNFWKERLSRLGIPLLLYVLLINPIMFYTLAVLGIEPWTSYPNLQGSLVDYYFAQVESLRQILEFLTDFGPMWFLYVLLILTLVYTLWRQVTKSDSFQHYIPKDFPIPNYLILLLLAVILGFLSFLFRIVSPIDEFPLGIPVGYILQYLMMFCVGVIAVRYDWFEKITNDQLKFWSRILVVTTLLFYSYVFIVLGADSDLSVMFGGLNFPALVFALVDNIINMGVIFVLIPIFYLKFNTQ